MNKLVNSCLVLIATLSIQGCSSARKVEICKFKDGRQAAVSLTYDDGIIDHYTLVAPNLERVGLRGTFWINAAIIGEDTTRLSWEQCRKLVQHGHEVSNHGWSHRKLTNLSAAEIEEEVSKCDDAIEKFTRVRPITFCFPYNAHNELVDSICLAGRVGARMFQVGHGQANNHSTLETMNDWLDKVIDEGEWGVTMTHGIHNGWDQWEDESALWKFYENLCLRQDQVWVGTFVQVCSYIQERDNCTLETSWKGRRVTITPSCSLDPSLFKERLSVRIGEGKGSRIVEIDPFGGPQTFDLSDPLLGRKIVFFGDSYVRNHQRPYTETWHYKLAERHHMRYVNFGINGNCVGFDRTDRGFGEPMTIRQQYLPADADYIVIVAGHNDAGFITASEEAHQTFLDHLEDLLTLLEKKYPKGKIAWVTPWDVNAPGFEQMHADVTEACARHGIPVLDAAHTSGILVNDPEFRAKYFQSPFDTAHLNSSGHDLLLDWGDEFLKSL